MKTHLLVLTPSLVLGELIRQTLHEGALYQVFNCDRAASAISYLESHKECAFVILDAALGDKETFNVALALRTIKWDIKIVLMAKSEIPPQFQEIQPWRLLRQPFIFQDLWHVLEGVWPTVIDLKATSDIKRGGAVWLNDARLASQTLNELTAGSDIQHALILRDRTIWASTGVFEKAEIEEINYFICSSMDFRCKGDLFRYVRVAESQEQHGLYATFLVLNTILGLVFGLGTPLSRIRIQARVMAESLSSPRLFSGEIKPVPLFLPDLITRTATNHSVDKIVIPKNHRATDDSGESVESVHPKQPQTADALVNNNALTKETRRALTDDLNRRPRIRNEKIKLNQNSHHLVNINSAGQNNGLLVENFVAYSCLLTPRFESCKLEGQLAELLTQIFPKICIAFGWRLAFFELGRDYFEWVAELPPNIRPVDHFKLVRKATSDCIDKDLPECMRDNLLGDFWAPGYSVRGGTRHYTEEQITSFVQKNKGSLIAHRNPPGTRNQIQKRLVR